MNYNRHVSIKTNMQKSLIPPTLQTKRTPATHNCISAKCCTSCDASERTRSEATQPRTKQIKKPLRRVSQLSVEASDIYRTMISLLSHRLTVTSRHMFSKQAVLRTHNYK